MSEQNTGGVAVGLNDLLGELRQTAEMLETYAAECFPADENGQVHFARAMMESAAPALRAADAEIKRLRAALSEIADPIAAWRRDLKTDERLDGGFAQQLALQAETYKRMARDALKPNAKVQP